MPGAAQAPGTYTPWGWGAPDCLPGLCHPHPTVGERQSLWASRLPVPGSSVGLQHRMLCAGLQARLCGGRAPGSRLLPPVPKMPRTPSLTARPAAGEERDGAQEDLWPSHLQAGSPAWLWPGGAVVHLTATATDPVGSRVALPVCVPHSLGGHAPLPGGLCTWP